MASEKSSWPEWPLPKEKTLLALAKKFIPLVRFLDPEIIMAIVENNNRHRGSWISKIKDRNINPDLYLWRGSCCAFPGIRRYSGKKEQADYNAFNREGLHANCFRIDGNEYPKQIWSFILCGSKFGNKGPKGYSLAHLADHKAYHNRMKEEFEAASFPEDPLYGLFTAPSNTVYMPENLMRISDFNGQMRLLLLNKAQSLYQKAKGRKGGCNMIPPGMTVKPLSAEWHIDNFDWAEPVKCPDPEKAMGRLDAFFKYREEVLARL